MNAEIFISQTTSGEYLLRIESEDDVQEIAMSPEEFAKAVTGKLAASKFES